MGRYTTDLAFKLAAPDEVRVYRLCRESVYGQLSRSGPAGTSRRTRFAQHYVGLSSPH